MFNDREKYKLTSAYGTLHLDRDPMGWKDSETDIIRSEKTYGVFLSISNNLQFTGKAKDFLETNYDLYGVMAKVKLTKQVKHPKTDEWQLAYTGYLDFTTRKIENNKFSIDFIEGGLRELLVSQMKEKFELNRTTDIKGNTIYELAPDVLTLEGRDIYLLSKLESTTGTYMFRSGEWDSGEDFREAYAPLPMEVMANSDPANIGGPIESLGEHQQNITGSHTMFFLVADRDRGRTRIKLNATFRIDHIDEDDVSNPSFKVVFRKYTDGDTFTLVEEVVLEDIGNPFSQIGNTFTIDLEDEIKNIFSSGTDPLEGESFTVGFFSNASYGDGLGDTGHMNIVLNNYSASLQWAEDSFFDRTNCNFMTAFEVGKRLSEIYTGSPAFESSLLTNDWPDLGFTCGGWIRNLRKKTEAEVEIDWPLTISFEQYYKSIHAIEPVGYGIVSLGNKQYIAFEKLRYFFQPYTTIRLGKVANIKRQTAAEFVFASIATGYSKGGNYEKPLGLDEYNIQANYITPVTKVDTKYEAIGESRTDSYAVEDARRMPYEDFPDQDTPYDKDNFLIDAKVFHPGLTTTYEPRLWQDDFESAPTGVYSPETAFNLRLTPAYNRNRHAYWFNAATVKFPTDKVRYTNNEGNSQLQTTLIGGTPIKENDDILISELSNPLFEPEWVEFELPFTQEVMDQLTGSTKINGQEVNNYYGMVEFLNERNQKEKAYLFTAKIKNEIKFKALKAYGF